MEPIITTITSCWGRAEMLQVWLEAMRGCTINEVEHLLFFVGEAPPPISNLPSGMRVVTYSPRERFSIGHCHNMGARLANSEWIMKIDVDTLPSSTFFRELRDLVKTADKREWFNCGMIYFKQVFSNSVLSLAIQPIGKLTHQMICQNLKLYSSRGYHQPAATNFICRTQDYVELGGCHQEFHGYGWEDYQQIYMLEKYQQAADPLPGTISLANVTQRCREEISRRKAAELFARSETFCLFHRWHSMSPKHHKMMDRNRRILFEYILKCRASSKLPSQS